MLYSILLLFMYWLCSIFIKEVKGLENIPRKGCIISSNHVSFLDPPLIGSYISVKLKVKVRFIGKEALFKRFLSRTFHNFVGSIEVDTTGKNKSWFKKAVHYINKGEIIGIFPEGTRSYDGKLQRGKTGAVRFALTTKKPIVPIGITGSHDIWPRHKKIFKIKRIVKVNIGKPIYFDKYYKGKITKRLLRQLTNNIMEEIAMLSKQKYNF